MRPIRRNLWCAAVLAVALVSPAAATATAAPARPGHSAPTTGQRFVVRRDASVPEQRFLDAARAGGWSVVRSQPALGLTVVSATSTAATELRGLPGVLDAAPDYVVHPTSLGFDAATQPGSMTNVTALTGAKDYWRAGFTGNDIGIAVLDTGVAPAPGLQDAAKVVVGPDLSFESQAPNARYLDSYGHGTVMSGIIAGREVAKSTGPAYAADTTNFYGMAPDARIVSIKLADRSGAVDVSQMIAAIEWLITNRYRLPVDVRVINISYGSKTLNTPQTDPLSWAAEQAWKSGMVVVASTGNEGSTTGVANPALNPWVIAVGAADTKGTATTADDTVAAFSNTNGSGRGPDLLAPGVGIIGPDARGSQIDATYPSARFGNGFIRGSGSSQAAAVVSGAVALVAQRNPGLGPDAIKRTLLQSASPLAGVAASAQGAGVLNLTKVLAATPAWGYAYSNPNGTGLGTLDASRAGRYLTVNGHEIKGAVDIMGRPWDPATIVKAMTDRNLWSYDGSFNGAPWAGTDLAADTTSWAGKTWQGKTWQGKTWQGSDWVGKTWQTGAWSTNGWTTAAWTGPVAASGWASTTWSSASWR